MTDVVPHPALAADAARDLLMDMQAQCANLRKLGFTVKLTNEDGTEFLLPVNLKLSVTKLYKL